MQNHCFLSIFEEKTHLMKSVKPPHLHGTDLGSEKEPYDHDKLTDNSSPTSTLKNLALLFIIITVFIWMGFAFVSDNTKINVLKQVKQVTTEWMQKCC
ncbi:MAG: hypothetical protein ACI88L_000364 [Candidatus Paceibacteria bacterium]